ncbi:MAG: hypothetical protein F9K16_02910 [Thermoanaerobaculia bacterium]|nr:MAG: hypothetical protein F9K16_02910 [Thermoanaerobaculia bacterium]MBZ0100647.1 hypothetical protein [Thermoanaerobaculia bacterium]
MVPRVRTTRSLRSSAATRLAAVTLALLGTRAAWAIPPGALDPDFGNGVHAGWVQVPLSEGGSGHAVVADPQGRVLVGSREVELGTIYVVVRRFLPSGSTSTRDRAFFVTRDAAGGLLLAGENVDALSPPYRYAAAAVRLLADGTPDPGYGANGGGRTQLVLTAGAYTWPEDAALDPNGGLLLTGGVREPGAQHTDAFVAHLAGRLVFRDGFESGSTAGWSSTTP